MEDLSNSRIVISEIEMIKNQDSIMLAYVLILFQYMYFRLPECVKNSIINII